MSYFYNYILRKNFSFRLIVIIFFISLLSLPKLTHAAKATIKEIDLTIKDEFFYVNAILKEGFTNKIKEAVSSGAVAQVLFYINIGKKRGIFFKKTFSKKLITYIVKYDLLKKQYQVIQSVQGKEKKSLTTDNWDEMVLWVSQLRQIEFPLSLIFKDNADHISIKAEMKYLRLPFPLNYLFNILSLWKFETKWKVFHF